MSDPAQLPQIALIGVTGYGQVHFNQWKRLHEAGRVRLAAAAVINPEEAAETMAWLEAEGASVYGDFAEMLQKTADKIDLTSIPTGISMHRPMVEVALQAGTHVLVEKPLSGCPDDAQAIIEAAEAAGRWVCVGFQAVWSPVTEAILDAIHGGRLGEVRKVGFTGLWPRPDAYFQRNAWAGRLRDRFGIVNDSPINNALAHYVNLSLLFAGPEAGRCARVKEVLSADLRRARDVETFDTVIARLATDTGIEVFVGVTHATETSRNPRVEIVGDEGWALWSMEEGWIVDADGTREELPGAAEETSRQCMFNAVADRLSGQPTKIYPASEAMAHVEAVAAITQATTVSDCRDQAIMGGSPDNPIRLIPGIDDAIDAAATQFWEE